MDYFEYCRLLLGSGWGMFKDTPLQSQFPGLDITGASHESWFSTHGHEERQEAGAQHCLLCVLQNGGSDLTAAKGWAQPYHADLSLERQSREHSLPQAADVHTILFLLVLHNEALVVIHPLFLTLQSRYHGV